VAGEIAVAETHRLQVRMQHREVLRFLVRHAQPVAVVGIGHAVEAPGRIQREVDGVELDVADRVDQRGAAFGRERRAVPDGVDGDAQRALGTARHAGFVAGAADEGHRGCRGQFGGVEGGRRGYQRAQFARGGDLAFGVGQAQGGEGAETEVHPYNSSFDLRRHHDGNL